MQIDFAILCRSVETYSCGNDVEKCRPCGLNIVVSVVRTGTCTVEMSCLVADGKRMLQH